jgi:hypothetical protein
MEPCNSCGLPIPHGARKCHECGDYQGYRRYLFFSSTILSLLIALGSVSALFWDKLYDNLREKDSVLFLAPTRFKAGEILVFAQNFGERSAMITGGSLRWYSSAAGNLDFSISPETYSVGPGEGKIIKFIYDRTEARQSLAGFREVARQNSSDDPDRVAEKECHLDFYVVPYSLLEKTIEELRKYADREMIPKNARIDRREFLPPSPGYIVYPAQIDCKILDPLGGMDPR